MTSPGGDPTKRCLHLFLPIQLVALAAPVALAGLDPDMDSMGIWLDAAGNSNCFVEAPFAPFTTYLLLSNPAGPTGGFACRVSLVGAPYFILATDLRGGADIDASAEGFLVGRSSPYPVLIPRAWPVRRAHQRIRLIFRVSTPSVVSSRQR